MICIFLLFEHYLEFQRQNQMCSVHGVWRGRIRKIFPCVKKSDRPLWDWKYLSDYYWNLNFLFFFISWKIENTLLVHYWSEWPRYRTPEGSMGSKINRYYFNVVEIFIKSNHNRTNRHRSMFESYGATNRKMQNVHVKHIQLYLHLPLNWIYIPLN